MDFSRDAKAARETVRPFQQILANADESSFAFQVSGTYGSTCRIDVSQGDTELLSAEARVVELQIHLEDSEELSGIAGGALDEVTMTLVDPDGNIDEGAEGSWALWLDPKAKKAPPGRTFENGGAVLEGVILPKRLRVVDGLLKVTVQRGGLRTDLEKSVKVSGIQKCDHSGL
jgi:hypothetical protein